MAHVRITKSQRSSVPSQNKWYDKTNSGSAPNFETRRTLQSTSREDANIEAESGETVLMPDKGGLPAHYNVNGNRHHSGGTPLNVPKDSFVFSDTRKMKIKDPIFLESFGKSSGSWTPAELAKKYDINKYRKLLQDPDSDKIMVETAEKMIANYNLKLGKLALVQESKKGFPQGIPAVAMPYLATYNIDPESILPMKQPETGPPQMRYGGSLPEYQVRGQVHPSDTVRHQMERTMLYEKGDPNNPNTGGGLRAGKAYGLSNWGFNQSQEIPADPNFRPPLSLNQALDMGMRDIDSRNKPYFPLGLTRGQANDFSYFTGRDIRPYVVDQLYKEKYGKPEGIPNRSQYNKDVKKSGYTPELKAKIDSVWTANKPQWDNLSYDQQQALMGLGRQSYGQSIERGSGAINENLEHYNEVARGRVNNLNSANYNQPIYWRQNQKEFGGMQEYYTPEYTDYTDYENYTDYEDVPQARYDMELEKYQNAGAVENIEYNYISDYGRTNDPRYEELIKITEKAYNDVINANPSGDLDAVETAAYEASNAAFNNWKAVQAKNRPDPNRFMPRYGDKVAPMPEEEGLTSRIANAPSRLATMLAYGKGDATRAQDVPLFSRAASQPGRFLEGSPYIAGVIGAGLHPATYIGPGVIKGIGKLAAKIPWKDVGLTALAIAELTRIYGKKAVMIAIKSIPQGVKWLATQGKAVAPYVVSGAVTSHMTSERAHPTIPATGPFPQDTSRMIVTGLPTDTIKAPSISTIKPVSTDTSFVWK